MRAVLARIPEWAGRDDLRVEPLPGGWTNRNYRLELDGRAYALRIASELGALLGIDRQREYAALRAASRAGVGAEVVHFAWPEGHLVTRFVEGRRWTERDKPSREHVERVAGAVRDVHALEPPRGVYSPYRAVEGYVAGIRAEGAKLPPLVERALGRLPELEAELARGRPAADALCHHDLSTGNFVDDGRIRILDWEYASRGDPLFDLAALVVAHGYEERDEEILLAAYFGGEAAAAGERERLELMKIVYDLREVTWSLLQLAQPGAEGGPLAAELHRATDLFLGRLERAC